MDEAERPREPCQGATYRRVEPGDTLYLIAQDLGVAVDDLTRLNPGVDPENLQIGSLICVPFSPGLPTGKVPPCESGLYWVIAPGDTLYSIARILGIPLDELMDLNPWADPENLIPGDSLCLPARASSG